MSHVACRTIGFNQHAGARRLGVLLSLCVWAGCSPPGPETVPVTGKVEFVKGGDVARLSDRQAAIEFESQEQPEMRAFGEILQDGTFTLTTALDVTGKEGVIPGTHRVRLNLDDDTKILVDPRFLDFATSGITVTLPSTEPIVIKIWK